MVPVEYSGVLHDGGRLLQFDSGRRDAALRMLRLMHDGMLLKFVISDQARCSIKEDL